MDHDQTTVGADRDPLTPDHKGEWEEGERALFEYRCYEGVDSSDSDLWARSHQTVTILGEADWEEDIGKDMTQTERIEAGVLKVYRIRFEDGHEGTAYEDELLTAPSWSRPHPSERVRAKENVDLAPIGEAPERQV